MSPDLSSSTLSATVAGLTRLLVVLLMAPGVIAAALVAGALALCLMPLLLLVAPGRRSGFSIHSLMPMRAQMAARRPAGS